MNGCYFFTGLPKMRHCIRLRSTQISSWLIVTTLAIVHIHNSPSLAEDWTHWRGSNRNDIVAESSGWMQNKWGNEDPDWKIEVGVGCSSPLIIKGKLYATGWKSGQDILSCWDAQSGKPLWSKSYPSPQYGRFSTGDKSFYRGFTSTPEYDAETNAIYTLSTDGELRCWSLSDEGRLLWKLNLYDQYGVSRRPDVGSRRRTLRDYGYTSSPLVYQKWLLVEVGVDSGSLIAFDKKTGTELWKSEHADFAGHTGSPVFMRVEGIPCVAVLTIRDLIVIRLDDRNKGKTLAKYSWTTDFANNIPTPTVKGNEILITTAYNHMSICKLRITTKEGAKKVWESNVCSGVCSPIISGDYIYWAWRGVHCLDWKTGKELWSGGKIGSTASCLMTSDNRLVVWANNGELFLVESAVQSPKKYQELFHSKSWFKTDAWPHVVLANRRLYCKDREGTILCFSLNSKKE